MAKRNAAAGPYPEHPNNCFDAVNRTKVGYKLGQFFGEANRYGFIPQASFSGVPNPPNISHDGRLPGDQGYLIFNAGDHYRLGFAGRIR